MRISDFSRFLTVTSISRRIISEISLVASPRTEIVSAVLKSLTLAKSSELKYISELIPQRFKSIYPTEFERRVLNQTSVFIVSSSSKKLFTLMDSRFEK